MKQTAVVICPGRGTYNAAELGYLKSHHSQRWDLVERLDAVRRSTGQIPISDLDNAGKYLAATHMNGENASLLIYACALADYAAIDRDRYEIVGVTGNSMGWYLALACAGVLDFEAGGRLVNSMGRLMSRHGSGGQIVWPIIDADWKIDARKLKLSNDLLSESQALPDINVHVSIELGGMLVFAADDAGLQWLSERLPRDDRFPMRLMYHSAFHSPLLDYIVPLAQSIIPVADFSAASVAAIDGRGKIWSPKAFDAANIYDYTLGAQLTQIYQFSRAVQVAVAEFAPDKIIVLGPGITLGAPTAQALIAVNWRGLAGKADFQARQMVDPLILSMGIAEQRRRVIAG